MLDLGDWEFIVNKLVNIIFEIGLAKNVWITFKKILLTVNVREQKSSRSEWIFISPF